MDITGTVNGLSRNESYNYDQVGRLTQASGFYTQRNYTYDRWGNRTAVSGGQTQSVTLQQPGGVTNNRIASVNGLSYGYDASGNVTSDGVKSYQYDAESRLVNVDNALTAIYSYDSENRRVKKVSGSASAYYVWEGSQCIAEYSTTNGALIAEYISAGGRMIAREAAGVTRYFHQDRLSARLMTDASGNVVGRMDNLPFGDDGGVSGESEKHRYTTYERDSETTTDYAVNRQYQTSVGRFNRPDPVQGSIANPQSLNRYAYTMNDPVNLTDPEGLDPIVPFRFSAMYGGTGVYWDGAWVPQGGLGMVFGALRMGAGVIAPFGSTARQGRGGTTELVIERYISGHEAGGVFRMGVSTQTITLNDVWWTSLIQVGYGGQRSEISSDRRFYKEPTKPKSTGSGENCYNKWKFSSTIAGLVGEEYRGIAEALEIISPLSLGSDILATIAKAQRKGVGGPTHPYASGMTALFRAIGKTLGLPSWVRKGLTFIGDKATPYLRFAGAAVAGYNAGIFIQCLFGLLR